MLYYNVKLSRLCDEEPENDLFAIKKVNNMV